MNKKILMTIATGLLLASCGNTQKAETKVEDSEPIIEYKETKLSRDDYFKELNFYSLLKIRLPTFSIFWFCLYFIVLIISCLFSVYDSEVYKLLYYSVMMPFLFFV